MTTSTTEIKTSTSTSNEPPKPIPDSDSPPRKVEQEVLVGGAKTAFSKCDDSNNKTTDNNGITTQQKSVQVTPPPTSKRSLFSTCEPGATEEDGKRLKVGEPPACDDCKASAEALTKLLFHMVDPVELLSNRDKSVEAFAIHVVNRTTIKDVLAGDKEPACDSIWNELPAVLVAGNMNHLDYIVDEIAKCPHHYAKIEQDLENPDRALIAIEVHCGLADGTTGISLCGSKEYLGFVIGKLQKALKNHHHNKDGSTKESSSMELVLLDSKSKVEDLFKAIGGTSFWAL